MRIFVIEPHAVGGMIHYAYQLCTALAAHGADVTLVTAAGYEMADHPHTFTVVTPLRRWAAFDPRSSQPPRGKLARLARALHWQARRAMRALRLVHEWIKLSRFLLRQRPDIVQFGKINFPFEAVFLAYLRRRGLRLADICHEFELREQASNPLARLSNRLYRHVYNQFATIFLHGESNRARFLSLFAVPPDVTHVIDHGNEMLFAREHGGETARLALRRRYQLTDDAPIILFFGNLTASKGLPDLLRAFALVRRQVRARLIIAGYPTKYIDLPALHALAAELGATADVIFDMRYLPVAEVGPLMEMAAVVAYPYHSSSQSGALQVAYSFGRPVVATRVGGLPDAVEEARSGLLVPPHQPQALAAALLRLLQDPALAAQMGAYARHLSQTRFAWSPIAAHILAAYVGGGGGKEEGGKQKAEARPASRSARLALLTTPEAFLALAPEWNDFLRRCRADNVFLTWEWVTAWWRHFGDDYRPWVLTLRGEDGGLRGIAPLMVGRKRLPGGLFYRQLLFIGSGRAAPDHLEFMTLPGDGEAVDLLARAVWAGRGWDVLHLESLPPASPTMPALQQLIPSHWRETEPLPCPFMRLPADWETLRMGLGKNQRRNIKRYDRYLAEANAGAVRYVILDEEAARPATLETLARLHQAVQQEQGRAGAFSDARMLPFQQTVAARFQEQGWLRVYQLRLGETPIAIMYCFRYGPRLSFYITGYDLEWSRFGPGRQVIAYALQDCVADGLTVFDFLRGDEAYKYDWGAETQTNVQLRAARTWWGKSLMAAQRLRRSLRS